MREVVRYGAAYSEYSRIARLALLEKGVEHRSVEVDIFEPISVPASYQRRQPFGKIPALSRGLAAETYAAHMVMPDFYFHLTVAYCILRHNGVPLGKPDFIGKLATVKLG